VGRSVRIRRMRTALRRLRTTSGIALGTAAFLSLGSFQAAAQERLLFPARDNIKNEIVNYIKNETVRVDIAVWYLTQRAITLALVNKFKAGVPVRVIGDRVSIFEIDPRTRAEFEMLAKAGIPIRLRYHPTSFPTIMHWKCGIFVGQGVVEFGSANWTPYELEPASATNYKDETALITDDDTLVNPFKTQFEEFWANTAQFLDWPEAYQRETGQAWTVPMTIDRTRLEPNHPSPSSMVWEQGTVLNNRMTAEINQETEGVDIVIYRLSVPNITTALIGRVNAGVPVRVMVEPTQYRQISWPEYWLTGARVDQLWVAGAQIKERKHQGLTHMKVLITSQIGMSGSSNFTKNWQRDHNYFIPAVQKPWLYGPLRDEFDRMWNDTVNHKDFYPKKPNIAALASPANGATNQSLRPTLRWNRAAWAVAYDVYLGTTPSNMTFQARINATLSESPPATYSWTPSTALLPNTLYRWRVVSRTFATAVDASLIGTSTTRTFTTAAAGGGAAAGPTSNDTTIVPRP
jgi:PLD-like domain